MKTHTLVAAAIVAFAVSLPARAQDKPQEKQPDRPIPAATAPKPTVPLRVQLVISRYDGDKKISSQPFTLSVNAGPYPNGGDLARLRIGVEVPVVTITGSKELEKQTGVPTVAPVQYKPIGTNIDCMGYINDDGGYRLQITVDDSSVFAEDHARPGTAASSTNPVFRSFRLTNTAVLRDGQSMQFTSATEKVSGETLKVDVTLNVVK